MKPSVSSLYQAVEILQNPAPLLIGERCNANGSKRFRERLLADDYEGCLKIALGQQESGAHLLDLCTAYAGRDEKQDMIRLVKMFARSVRLPLVIDSTNPDCIEAALSIYPGRCIVNSINLEDGGDTLDRMCPLLRRYGAAVIALTIGKSGMAMTAADKIDTAKRICSRAVETHGLRPSDILVDPLTFTVGSGDESLRDAAVHTLEAIRTIKAELPGMFTVLGVSNISFGLPSASRKILNSVFLHEAVAAGLDAAIIDAARVVPLAAIAEQDRTACLDLLYNRSRNAADDPLMRYIEHFTGKGSEKSEERPDTDTGPAEQALGDKVLRGDREGIEDLLSILLRRYPAQAVINTILIPAMRHVGVLFGKGEMLLPFVLQSAEVMKAAVGYLEPFLDKSDEEKGLKILLATVQGDVHEIGKNLVDIILSNNGYTVYNLGVKVPAETILAKATEYNVDLVGLSGLLVKSAVVMQESMSQYRAGGLDVPILLGGAALTRKFVAQSCVPQYDAPIVYCADAFAGLKAVQDYEQGKLESTTYIQQSRKPRTQSQVKGTPILHDVPIPDPPFFGVRHRTDISPTAVFPYLNEQALFRGRWGYRRGNMPAKEYQELIAEKVMPLYEELKQRAVHEQLARPAVAYGYFRCHSAGDMLLVEHDGKVYEFGFPRRQEPPLLCISDFFRSAKEGGDVAGFFVATIGEALGRAAHELFEADAYHDYLMLHGFGVELTDALAEYWHAFMRRELGIASEHPTSTPGPTAQEYRGSRYGFGYPACPSLAAQKPVFAMLRPEAVGVTLTETMAMVPEQSTSAIVAHHPQAKYFAV